MDIMEELTPLLTYFDVRYEEVCEFRNEDTGMYGIDVSRVSWLLSIQLTSTIKNRTISSFSVTDVIQNLEGRRRWGSRAKKAEEFRHLPLQGLWKAHYTDARFLYRNMMNEVSTTRKVGKLLTKVADLEKESPSPLGWQGTLAHEMTIGAYEKKATAKSLTGEWIIFSKYEKKNYYICIATHTSTKEEDTRLHNAIVDACSWEFPFLSERTR